MTARHFSIGITLVLVLLATMFGVSHNALAATACTPTSTISGPYAQDGVGDLCFQTTNLCSYINSWNLSTLEINGAPYTNQYVASNTILPVNGVYIIHYVSSVAWGHFETGGTCSGGGSPTNTPAAATSTPTRTNTPVAATPTRTNTPAEATSTPASGTCSPVTATISAPFSQDGAGSFCWQSGNLGNYINSWNLSSLKINGVDFTNTYVSSNSYPAQINGYWYVSYSSSVSWGHFEAVGAGGWSDQHATDSYQHTSCAYPNSHEYTHSPNKYAAGPHQYADTHAHTASGNGHSHTYQHTSSGNSDCHQPTQHTHSHCNQQQQWRHLQPGDFHHHGSVHTRWRR